MMRKSGLLIVGNHYALNRTGCQLSKARLSLVSSEAKHLNFSMMNRTGINKLLKILSKHMRERRKSLGLTQEQLADKSGLSPNYIAKLEMEKRIPSVSALVSLSEALEVKVSELIAEESGQVWMDATEEMTRIMKSLNAEDTEFALDNLRMVVNHVKRLRSA
jgi:transcriptional regulator with XRE-family HTH domain